MGKISIVAALAALALVSCDIPEPIYWREVAPQGGEIDRAKRSVSLQYPAWDLTFERAWVMAGSNGERRICAHVNGESNVGLLFRESLVAVDPGGRVSTVSSKGDARYHVLHVCGKFLTSRG